MPVIDIERVLPDGAVAVPSGLAQALADAAAAALACPPGLAWVRLRALAASAYAESGVAPLAPDALPVFVTLLQAHPPEGAAREAQVRALTEAMARVLACDVSRVHVLLAPPAAGRQAFGGRIVT